MATSTAAYFKGQYDSIEVLGRKSISSDYTMEVEGFEGTYLLCKQFPWPTVSSAGEIEVAAPLGMAYWETQNIKVNQQGSVSFYETTANSIDNMLAGIIARGGRFNAKIYHGTPDNYLTMKPIYNAFLQIDNPDTDFENRSQVLMFAGTIFFMYFGEVVAGNVNTL